MAWLALLLANLAAIGLWPSWDTIPFHLISICFALLFWLRVWPADPMPWGIGIVLITTVTGTALNVLHHAGWAEEVVDAPLLALMFVAMAWHATRRIAADAERQLIGEENARLLAVQRQFLQDASHHLRTPVTIALTYAELLARELTGEQELRDIQMVVGEMTRLRLLSDRLLVIAAAEDPDFLRTGPVALDELAMEAIERWRPTAERRWKLGRLDAVTVLADQERLGLAVDALLENAVKLAARFPGTALLGEPGYRTMSLGSGDAAECLSVIVREGVRAPSCRAPRRSSPRPWRSRRAPGAGSGRPARPNLRRVPVVNLWGDLREHAGSGMRLLAT